MKEKITPRIGRPEIEIDENIVIGLARIQCTLDEIGSVVGCSRDTLERRFAAVIREAKEYGKSSLRRHMWKSVERGNVVMMIWLSKQLLGMKDRFDHNHFVPVPESFDYSKLSDTELDSLEALIKKAKPEKVIDVADAE